SGIYRQTRGPGRNQGHAGSVRSAAFHRRKRDARRLRALPAPTRRHYFYPEVRGRPDGLEAGLHRLAHEVRLSAAGLRPAALRRPLNQYNDRMFSDGRPILGVRLLAAWMILGAFVPTGNAAEEAVDPDGRATPGVV